MCLRHSVVSLQVTYKLHPKTAQQWKRRKKKIYPLIIIQCYWPSLIYLFIFLLHSRNTRRKGGNEGGWSATVVDRPFCGPAVQATKVSLDVFLKRRGEVKWGGGVVVEWKQRGRGVELISSVMTAPVRLAPNAPTPPFHHPHPSVRSLHPCASAALGKWPLVVSCSWRVCSTAPLHLSFPSNCREIVGADRFSDKSIIFGTKDTLRNLMTVFFLTLSFFPLFSNVSLMHNSGNSNKRHVFSFRLIRNMVQVSLPSSLSCASQNITEAEVFRFGSLWSPTYGILVFFFF